MRPVGLLALQGGYAAHGRHLKALGIPTREVRRQADLDRLGGLVFPGGESTAQLKLIHRFDLWAALDELVRSGMPVLCTCAGLILAARKVSSPVQGSFGWLDVAVARNAWGRQVHSFQSEVDPGMLCPTQGAALPLIFIRAPRITDVAADHEVLLAYQGEPILVRKGNVFGATFHPELTSDLRIHRLVFGP